jgi:hypothetical protein
LQGTLRVYSVHIKCAHIKKPMKNHEILGAITQEELDKHAIIQPPKEFKYFGNDTKYTRIIVDSMYRDKALYPSPNDYNFVFDDDINDVMTARLIVADIPFNDYVINAHFNKLYLEVDGGAETSVTLTQGLYDKSGLASHIQTQLNATFGANVFTVQYSSITDKYTFMATKIFTINFEGKTNGLNALLGFAPKNYSAPAFTPFTAPFRCNFAHNNYIVMCIDQFDNNKSNTKPHNKSFAILTDKISNINFEDDPNIIKTFNPPIPRLPKIRVTFFDRYGNPYDFNNKDHRFELLFTGHKQRRKYHSIFGLEKNS